MNGSRMWTGMRFIKGDRKCHLLKPKSRCPTSRLRLNLLISRVKSTLFPVGRLLVDWGNKVDLTVKIIDLPFSFSCSFSSLFAIFLFSFPLYVLP